MVPFYLLFVLGANAIFFIGACCCCLPCGFACLPLSFPYWRNGAEPSSALGRAIFLSPILLTAAAFKWLRELFTNPRAAVSSFGGSCCAKGPCTLPLLFSTAATSRFPWDVLWSRLRSTEPTGSVFKAAMNSGHAYTTNPMARPMDSGVISANNFHLAVDMCRLNG